jgi:hypothetical protein
MDVDDDDDDIVLDIVPPNANATAKKKSPAESTSITSTQDDTLDTKVLKVKPSQFMPKPPPPPPPPNAAGRAPPASTQQDMKVTPGKSVGTAPSQASKINDQPPRFKLKSCSVRRGKRSGKRIKIGESLAVVSWRPAASESKPPGDHYTVVDLDTTNPAVSTMEGKSDKTTSFEAGSNGASLARQQSHGAVVVVQGNDTHSTGKKPEDKKPKVVDLLMVRVDRSRRDFFCLRASSLSPSLTQTSPSFG